MSETVPPLLIVWHSRTNTSAQLAQAAARGAGEAALILPAAEVDEGHLMAARGYLFICPENLASMSGMMKEMFDRTYYPVLGRIEGRPYATIIAAGSDGEGAQRQIDRIAKGWRLRRVMEPMIVCTNAQDADDILAEKTPDPVALDEARACGEGFAEGLAAGVF